MERAAAGRVPEAEAATQMKQQLDEEAKYGVTTIQELAFLLAPARAVSLLKAIPTQIRVRVVRMPGTTTTGRNIGEGKGVPVHPAALITVSGSSLQWHYLGGEEALTSLLVLHQ